MLRAHHTWLVLALCACIGCPKKNAAKPDPRTAPRDASLGTRPADAASDSALARAKSILDAQVAALRKDDASLASTFTSDAYLAVPRLWRASEPRLQLRAELLKLPPNTGLTSLEVGNLVAGGNANAVWFSAELTVVREDELRVVRRITELATAESGWKVVAAAVTTPTSELWGRKTGPAPLPDGSSAGPLTALLGDPAGLSTALATEPSLVVFGPNDRAEGAAAKALVSGWNVALENNSYEVRGSTWGFALANVQMTVSGEQDRVRLVAFLIAVPESGTAWSVVSAHYGAL